jgi:5-formyltetrahydrofolate cyclo-ligase
MVIKSELRAEMARRRAEASAANPLTGLTLSAWAPAQMFRSGIVVSAYWPYRSEIDPRPLMQRFANAGARLALPVTPAKGSDDPLRFHIWSAGDALHPRAFGVKTASSRTFFWFRFWPSTGAAAGWGTARGTTTARSSAFER